jgi:hypothetical protein
LAVGLPIVASRADEAEEATAEAALSRRRDVLKAGENTKEVKRTENCSSTTQRGEPSGTRFVHNVSNKQRSLILFSLHEEDVFELIETNCVATTCGNERRIAKARIAVAAEAHVQLEIATFDAFEEPQEEEEVVFAVGESFPPKPSGARHNKHATSRTDCVKAT